MEHALGLGPAEPVDPCLGTTGQARRTDAAGKREYQEAGEGSRQ
jgi:hypothetical protein